MEKRFKKPTGWQESYFTNARGREIRYGHVFPKNAKALISMNVGLSEFCEKYFEVMNELTAQGYAVSIHDWMGQGLSDRYLPNPHKRHIGTFQDDVDDYFDLMDHHILPKIEKKYGTNFQRMIVAHSMGAHITLHALLQRPDFASSAFLSAPLTRIKACGSLPEPMTVALLQTLNTCAHREYISFVGGDWKEGQRRLMSHDTTRNNLTDQWFTKDTDLQIGAPTVKWVYEAIMSCRTLRNADPSSLKIPFHLAMAEKDVLVDNNRTIEFIETMPNASYDIYENAYHELFMEEDTIRTPVMHSLQSFAEKTLGR